jgi:predicted membrane protein
VVNKLLSLDTPVSGRIFEIALLLGLIIGAAYVKNSVKDTTVQFAAALVLMFGALILFIMLAVLVAVVVRGASETRPKDEK